MDSPAGDGDLHLGGGDVAGDRVEVVHRRHVLELVHNVSLHHLHRQSPRRLGSDPGAAQPGPGGARRLSGDSGDQIRDQVVSGATGRGSHFTNVGAGKRRAGRTGGGGCVRSGEQRNTETHLVNCPCGAN